MQAHHYPFIDLAVHASVRNRFANGDAVAVMSPDLDEVLWANGAAANLLGFDTIYDVLDNGFGGQISTRRQIESAVSGLRRTGKPQSFMMRVASGFSRLMAQASLEHITLPDGAQALLLSSSQAGKMLAPGARARQIISGFEGTGTHVAVLDKDGRVLAASSTFGDLGLADSAISKMITDVATEDDRLIKRMTQARNGSMPTAIGRLADDPALHLLFAVEPATMDDTEVIAETTQLADALTNIVPSGEIESHDEIRADATADADQIPESDTGTAADVIKAEQPAPPPRRFDTARIRDELNARLEKARLEAAKQADDVPLPLAATDDLDVETVTDEDTDEPDSTAEQDQRVEDTTTDELVADDIEQEDAAPEQATASDDAAVVDVAADGPAFRFDPNGKPTRFVWKINRDGEFSEVSPEFALAVGPHSADIIGRTFPDLARVFNLDPDHVISDLLSRRDTWSGKTVYWPIQGTDLVTPVDLAALPTYSRDRSFDGFRGFGIVRTGETRHDPEALGLALVPGAIARSSADMSEQPGLAEDIADDDQSTGSSDYPDGDFLSAEDEAALEQQNLERDIEDLARIDRSESDDEICPEKSDPAETGAGTAAESDDPFRGERPALHLVETPMRRDSDKVIDLEARRSRPRESLSPGEQAAFKEIGARLNETSSAHEAEAKAKEARREANVESTPPAHPDERQTFGKRQAFLNDGQSGNGDVEVSFDDDQPDEPAQDTAVQANARAIDAPASEHETDTPAPAGAAEGETPAEAPLPSAFALPARQVMQAGLDSHLVDAIPAALLVHSGDELIHANADFFKLTGYGSLADLAACGGLDQLLDRPSEEETMDDGGMLVRRADGGTRKVTARLRSVNWGDGQALLLALSPIESAVAPLVVDPTTPVEVEATTETNAPQPSEVNQDNALKIEAQELRSILETATDGVVILDNDGTIRSMNGSACALFNYDESQTHRQPFAMLFAHESQRAVMDYVSGLADHGVSSVLNDGREVIGREAAGGFLPLFMTIGRLSGSNGFCAVLRDITQWKRTEDELRNAKRAAETANSHKSDFLARVSHEIRTPLNAIIGFSEMMVEERFGPIGSPRYLEYAHDIGNSGKHVLDIVNDLLDISKIEAGQVEMEFVAVSLNDHLAESVSLLQPMANSQRVIIRTSLSASVPEVVADQRSIKQIALNLLSNAIRYTPSGGQIVVSTSYEPSGNVVIRIRDTGIGMNRKELEQAMKPFGQVGPGPRQRGDGTGLGLPLTKAMVESNRAQFDIVSAPGEGTLVSIAFPPQRVLAD